jgi:hypothetical protein
MKLFKNFLTEQKDKPKVETTGHLTHAGDFLYSGTPDHAIHHHEKMFDRLHNNTEDPNHPVSLKVDGGMSFLMGKNEEGKPFVSYKSAKQRFYSAKDIIATGKPHYEKLLIPALYSTMKMKSMPAGTAIQADHLYDEKPGSDNFTSNTIPYSTPSTSASFGFAPHSQYDVRGNDLIKTSNEPDHSHFKSDRIFAPKLTFNGKKFNPMNDEVVTDIQTKMGTARAILNDQGLKNFASTLPDDKKFHAALQGYSNHVTRTSGVRSTDDLAKHVATHVARRKVSDGLKKKELDSHMQKIEDNREHFDALFGVHNILTDVKHHMTGHLKDNQDLFDIRPYKDGQHEGIVATSGETGTTAKFVPEGPDGFAAQNAARSNELRKKTKKK